MVEKTRHNCNAALIGYPNAGKSTLFAALTGLPYSNKMPRYGEVAFGDFCQRGALILADIGGLLSGVKENVKNPGIRWLRFAASAKLLVYVIKAADGNEEHHLAYLRKTVSEGRPDFSDKRDIAVINHFETGFSGAYTNGAYTHVNAMTGTGLQTLLRVIGEKLKEDSNVIHN